MILLSAGLCQALALGLAGGAAAQGARGVPEAPVLSGDVRIVGSGVTVMPILELWKARFVETHPGATIDVSGEGTTWGPVALMSDRANLAAMSRHMTEGELKVFRDKTGAAPVAFPIAMDAIAIYVHGSNPIDHLNLSQVDSIFSLSRRCGAKRALHKWGDLGLTGEWSDRPIEPHGQGRASGTGEWFQEHALCGGILTSALQDMGGRGKVAMAVAETPAAIGFETGARHLPGAKAVPLAPVDSNVAVPLQFATVKDETYPLHRRLYLYAKKPISAGGKHVVDFLRFALSEEGQKLVEEAGYVALSEKLLAESRSHLPQ